MFIVHQGNTLQRSFRVTAAVGICVLGKVFQGFKQQQLFSYTFPSKQTHTQYQQKKPQKYKQKIIQIKTRL